MKSMRTWLVAAAMVAGGLGLGAGSAQAQSARYDHRPVVHVARRYEGGYVYAPAYRYDYRVRPYVRFEGGRSFDRRGDRDRRR